MPPVTDARTLERKRSPLIIVGILALLVAGLGGGAGLLVRYQPIVRGSSGLFPSGKAVPSTDPSDDRPTYLVTYVDGKTTTFGFSIRNSGRWGVPIVGLEASTTGMLDQFMYRLSDSGFTTDKGPFKAFALAPQAEQAIKVIARFWNCESYVVGGSAGMESVNVRFKVLGVERSTSVPLGERIEVMSPPNANCPRPRAA